MVVCNNSSPPKTMPPKPPDPKDAPFPTFQLVIIGICRFSEPLAFNSILAYSYEMVLDLGVAEKDAATYAGLLVSAYAVAEAMTAMGWGAISDVYGRKPVALFGLCGVALSSVMFGLAKSYWVALAARFIGGALNGNVAIMQTMVAEMVTNPDHEPRAYATQPFVWTLGGIIGSAMGGFLAQPAKFYPTVFDQDGIFGQFPYLLPNLVAAIGIVAAIIQGMLFLDETNPRYRHTADPSSDGVDERTPLHRHSRHSMSRDTHPRDRTRSISVAESMRQIRKQPSFMEDGMPMPLDQRFDIRRSSFGTMHSIKLPHDLHHSSIPDIVVEAESQARPPPPTFNFTIIMLTLSLVFICYHQMAFITTMPVYLLAKPSTDLGLDWVGGLGMTLHDVGTFLAVNGFIALFIQGVIFPLFVENLGVWRTFVGVIVVYPTVYMIVPFISLLPPYLTSPGVYFAFTLQSFFGILVVPCALILLKNATPSPLVLGRVNGLAMSACCLARTVSPPLVGVIYSIGGSAASWISLMIVAILGVVQLFWVPREHVDTLVVESGFKAVPERDFDEDIEEAIEDY
ncbi:MFS general substrate transporter [Melanomma pulvis-pyrius CBS 109.77]|uniref:MFS general substrate transporter n=1 Tax=Melanomma pulvis-pyrius CBS 109.77 TaxID=1314802 RepID=A0A6A6WPF8_9PLEO|nr:MFS general substrate transporter [Melanomma pulvis-pyrius CBS 109.77]